MRIDEALSKAFNGARIKMPTMDGYVFYTKNEHLQFYDTKIDCGASTSWSPTPEELSSMEWYVVPSNFIWEDFKNHLTSVHCKNEEESLNFLKMCSSRGIFRLDGQPLSTFQKTISDDGIWYFSKDNKISYSNSEPPYVPVYEFDSIELNTWEQFVTGKICVKLNSSFEYDLLMSKLEREGYFWKTGDGYPTQTKYLDGICVMITEGFSFVRSNTHFFNKTPITMAELVFKLETEWGI